MCIEEVQDVRESETPVAVELIPASFGQRRLWWLQQVAPQDASYNLPISARLRGVLNRDCLEEALNRMVERHESLRTTFSLRDRELMQRIETKRPLRIETITGTRDELDVLLAERVRRPFDLGRDLMIRAYLGEAGANDHLLVLLLHHIAADEWSVGVLWSELSEIYNALVKGREPQLPNLEIQYADYAVWQREQIENEAWASQLNYWRERLRPSIAPSGWPTDHAQYPRESRPAKRVLRALNARTAGMLRDFARREQASLYTVLLAIFKALLGRVTGAEDVVLGMPVSGRDQPETERLIGFFVNTVVVRTDLGGDPDFREVVRRVRSSMLGAIENQAYPFDRLIEELRPERGGTETPFVRTMFSFEREPGDAVRLTGLQAEPYCVPVGAAKFDLVLVASESRSGLNLAAEYDADLYESRTIEDLLRRYELLAESALRAPEMPASRLPVLTVEERERAVVKWNATARKYPDDVSLGFLFLRSAESAGDRPAIVSGESAISYRELAARSRRLAAGLKQLGVGREVRVGVHASRTIDALCGMIGVVLAGGAYVPLDPEYPDERIEFMARDAGVTWILSSDPASFSVPEDVKVQSIEALTALGGDSVLDVQGASPDDDAYVIYTSGSTGKPKGVLVPHRAVIRLVMGTDYVQVQSTDVVAQASSLSFDAATFEIWGALLNGARLCLLDRATVLSPSALERAIRERGLSVMFLTTALFNQMARERPGAFGSMRAVLFGGELVNAFAVRTVLENGSPGRLLHVYGPTENTSFSSWFDLSEWDREEKTVPIGRPIANSTMYVLDRKLEPLPPGMPGEIFVGGAGLAKGYLNAAELTDEAFVPNPFSPGERLYRTGDLGRYRDDGAIEFLGRRDGQVKVRGFRVELGEVECAIREFAGVRDAAVVAGIDSRTGTQRLEAYVVFEEAADGAGRALRESLGRRLPEFMVPSVTVVERIPLNSNGKVDRARLPQTGADSGLDAAPGDYGSVTEERLARIWQDVLGVAAGPDDDFFERGGHSLLAVELFRKIEVECGVKLPLATLFQRRRLRDLARHIDEAAAVGSAESLIVPIQPQGSRLPIYWIHSLGGDGGGGFFYYRKLAELLGEDQPSFGVRSPRTPFRDVGQMAECYAGELMKLHGSGPYLLGGFCFGGVVAFEMARRLSADGCEVGMLALIESAPPGSANGLEWSVESARAAFEHVQGWAAELLRQGGRVTAERVLKRVACAGRRWARRLNCGAPMAPQEALREVIDMGQYPAEYVEYAEAHWEALGRHRPGRYDGGVTLFRARKQPLSRWDPALGWRQFAANVSVHVVPGTHDEMLKDPHVRVLAEQFRKCLADTVR